MEAEDSIPKEETVKCLSPKEMKALIRPEFEANPDKYYPTQTFNKLGFSRAHCKCGHYYWRKSQKATTCGDSMCTGEYSFIGKGSGIGRTGTKLTYKGAWDTFQKSLTTSKIPCTKINRFPVIARWRNDVDYVAAGIFCYQPYCVTGELQPPANPLICPQFCVRFNDLDNIGVTGRHYSGFIMMGIQVFNKPNEFIFFKDETIEFNYRWLTEELKIDPEEITFVEDIWAGGGNLGPCVEYFINGIEVGNMVFMQFKYTNEGKYQQLPVKVIDVGIGLERIPWLINGSSTSYDAVFQSALAFMKQKTEIDMNNEIWDKMAPYTCKLNVDEAENIEQIWKELGEKISIPVDKIKVSVLLVKELYVVLDHTRTILIIIQDGGLPSNTGGGSNCRNILRRVFSILKKNNWWNKIGALDGLIELFQLQKKDLAEIFGPFQDYKSFKDIIKIQYERWVSTEGGHKKKLQQLLAKNKGKLSLENWIMVMQSWGIPADAIASISKTDIPDKLYYTIAQKLQKVGKAAQKILYETIHFQATQNLYYQSHLLFEFTGKIVQVLKNVQQKQKGTNIVLLDRSAFYPTSGGQAHDTGMMTIEGTDYQVHNVQKVGKCFLHYLSKEVNRDNVIGKTVKGKINKQRRQTLISFHTGTHIVYAASRRVLGPHIWQHGAKKTQSYAHIDITHYSSITKELEMQIENQANKIVMERHPIKKYMENKSQAEKKHGFHLYQGGIVPGNQIRVVNIEDVDVEACCGTHADNTSEVGWIKIIKSSRISDGTLRLYFMAGTKVMKVLNEETMIINNLKDLWKINQPEIVQTATRFFHDYKKYEKEADKQKISLLGMHVRYISESAIQKFMVPSLERQMTLYFSNLNTNLVPIMESKKTVIFINDQFFFGIISDADHLRIDALKDLLKQDQNPQIVDKKLVLKKGIQYSKGKNKVKNQNGCILNFTGKFKEKKIIEFLAAEKFELMK